MQNTTIEPEAVKDALQRILKSKRFVSSQNLSNFLQYIVDRKLAGKARDLKAYSIAIDAFGKPASFDPQSDPIVRVHAGRLRTALSEYYAGDGADDPVRITVPTGGYVPAFAIKPEFDSEEAEAAEPVSRKPIGPAPPPRLVSTPTLVAVLFCLAAAGLAYPFVALLLSGASDDRPNAIVVLMRTRPQQPQAEASAEQSTRILRKLGAILSRNEAVTIRYPASNDTAERQADRTSDQTDFFVSGWTETTEAGEKLLVELSNSRTNSLVWARSFSLSDGDQKIDSDLVIKKIARELHTQIFGASIRALEGRDPNTLSARQLFVLATWIPGPAKNSLEWEKERVDLARLAIAKSPEFGPAHSTLADKLAYLAAVDGPSDTADAAAEAKASALRAVELAPGDVTTLFNVAQFHWHSGNLKDSIRAMKRVLELDPNHGLAGFFVLVYPYTCADAPDDVVTAAISFDESLGADNPIRWVTLTWLGWLHLNRGQFERALEAEKRAANIFQIPYTVMRHAAILNQLARADEAAVLLQSQKDNWPNIDPAHFSNVTMPRLCRDSSHGETMLGFYRDLTKAMAGK